MIKIRIKKKDKNLFFYKFDLTKIKYIKTIVKKISLKFNKIDVLILNAGICPFEKFLKIDQKLFDLVVNVNQKSAFFLAQQIASIMIKKKIKGKIIFTSSISSYLVVNFKHTIAVLKVLLIK